MKKIKSMVNIIAAVGISIFVAQAFYTLLDQSVYNHITSTVTTGRADQIQAYTAWYANYEWLLFIAEFLINIAVTAILLRLLLKRSYKDVRKWFASHHIRELALGLLLGAAAISIVFFILIATGNASVVSWRPHFTASALKYLLVFILVGISEEFFYRGFIITSLGTYNSKLFTILFSSMLFSLMHFLNNDFHLLSFLNVMLIGVLFAYIFIETNSLWLPIGYHILWNYFQGNVYGFHVSGIAVPGIFITEYKESTILNGGDFGPEGGLVTTVVTLLVFAFLKWYFASRKTPFNANQMTTMQDQGA